MESFLLDTECYINFWLAVFKGLESGKIFRFQQSPSSNLNIAALGEFMRRNLTVGFNSNVYDLPMIQLALTGASTEDLKHASDDIIVRGMTRWAFADAYGLSKPDWNHIDLIQVAPVKASLKIYAGRLHCRKMQDLPIEPDALITAETADQLFPYCVNDLDNTALLLNELEGQIKLRSSMSAEYGIDLRSKSDAQVAESVIGQELRKLNGKWPQRPDSLEGKSYQYQVPGFVSFTSPLLKGLLDKIRNAYFTVTANGSVNIPPELQNLDIRIGGGKYRIGIGGLHSSEECVSHQADHEYMLIDRDVASYYPNIILALKLFPKQLGEQFLLIYSKLVNERLAAKERMKVIKELMKLVTDNLDLPALQIELLEKEIETESKKISANGTFGKLGSKYSFLYAPDLLIQVTLTGQLCLLMLIERIEAAGISVISANTDGVTSKCRKVLYPKFLEVVKSWETITGFTTEETLYSAVYSANVNNYIAIKTDGQVKGKGNFSNPWEKNGPNVYKLHKNPTTTIVIEAVVALLRDGVPLSKTIKSCRDITKFIAIRTVNGGANNKGEYLGKAVRWYYSLSARHSVLNYKRSKKPGKVGNKVPKSDGAMPLMDLPDELPSDINYEYYVAEANGVLCNIGYAQLTLFPAA